MVLPDDSRACVVVAFADGTYGVRLVVETEEIECTSPADCDFAGSAEDCARYVAGLFGVPV